MAFGDWWSFWLLECARAWDIMWPVKKLALPLLLLVIFALTRWPGLMPENFSAVYAIAFCAALYLPGRWGWLIPLGVFFLTDLLLNLYYSFTLGINAFSPLLLANYIAYAAIILLGKKFTARASWLAMVGGGFLAAILFYLITNTVSWMHLPAYPKNLAGWIQALTVGTPGFPHTWEFFRNTLLSGGLFTALFTGAMKLTERSEEKVEEAEPVVEEEPAEETA
jgi:hypothetical protein